VFGAWAASRHAVGARDAAWPHFCPVLTPGLLQVERTGSVGGLEEVGWPGQLANGATGT